MNATRRLGWLLAMLAAVFLGFLVSPARAQSMVITLLHTNDIHGHLTPWRGWENELAGKTVGGLDRLAGAVNAVRAAAGADGVLLLDAGDTFGDTMIADETKGQAILDAMNAIGYTAMVIGNHDPDFTAQHLRDLISRAGFPIIAANIIDEPSGKLFTEPYIIKEVKGVKIGILGLAYPNTPLTTAKKNVRGLVYRDAPETAREFVPKLRDAGAQIVVVLSHYGLSADKQLAKRVPGIDVIVGGHSHNRVTHAVHEGDTLIVQAGAHGSDLGRLDLNIEGGKIRSSNHRLVLLDNAEVAPDPAVTKLIDTALAPHQKALDEPLATVTQVIPRAQTLAGAEPAKRDLESPADSLFADLIREKTKADVAILPGVGYGVALPAGPVTAGQLRNLIPHDSKVVTMMLTGAQIRDIFEQSLENTYTDDPREKVGGLVQFSGLRLKYDPSGSHARIVDLALDNGPLIRDREYKVATNSMLADGGHRYKTFLDGKNRQEGQGQYELVKAAFKERGQVAPPTPGRIKKAPDAPQSTLGREAHGR